ncbi:coagulation factor 5/8 type domain protein [Ruminiclostridium papyrosolvens DSM 2782]|uniref:Coagulation factor 5/8 type domain protein n=1 Tax=Ruminiclostridium papyrosolvens DSM 2782 TaxID=588581 RepID=F1TDG2_9FIRM|nr:discoidin domain-containing protein [Ruminiclostridium papyrosolvens]EGD47600.1 coagulation factor 5/8 type domain protein [Ruminiclostridium papyrosolvens DSM 2782]WES36455.1 discoidin domain-containing protein [Ruminiclostridium papyrosolvens DSM 2782]
MQRLHIPNYVNDSYYYKTISCWDAPIAIASGYFEYENYFYFCAFYSLRLIWETNVDRLDSINIRLNKLGLELETVNTSNRELLLSTIKSVLDEKYPIVIYFDYFNMFYCDFNYKKAHGPHGIIINGYNKETSTITIMDCSHVGFDNPFYCLTLKEEIFLDIWEESNEYFSNTLSSFANKLYYIKPQNAKKTIYSDFNFLKDVVENNYVTEDDNLIRNVINNKCFDITAAELYKRDLVDSTQNIFKILDRIYSQLDKDNTNLKNYEDFKVKYLNKRSIVFSSFLRKAIKRNVDENAITKYTNEIQPINNDFCMLINELYKEYCTKMATDISMQCDDEKELINYASDASITASSELEAYGVCFKAERVINGEYNGFDTDMWISSDIASPQWLILDLNKARAVKKFVIIHDFRSPELYLIDYCIQGSNNMIDWTNLVKIEGNIKEQTTSYVEEQEYRYYRIYITKPSKLDNMARIFGIECWGYKQE